CAGADARLQAAFCVLVSVDNVIRSLKRVSTVSAAHARRNLNRLLPRSDAAQRLPDLYSDGAQGARRRSGEARHPPGRARSPANRRGPNGRGSARSPTVPVNTAAELPAALHGELGPTHEQAIRRVRGNAVSKAHLNSRIRPLCKKGEPPQCRLIRRRL